MLSHAIALATSLLAPALPAATLRVPANYPALQQAIDAAEPGDTVLVAPGTWGGGVVIEGKSVRLVSEAGADLTVIDGGAPVVGIWNVTGAPAVVEGFTIRGGLDLEGVGVRVDHSNVEIRANRIAGNAACVGVGITLLESPALVEDNEITGNSSAFCTSGGGGAIGIGGAAARARILRNWIHHNYLGEQRGGGLNIAGPALVQDNRIEANETLFDGGGLYVWHPDVDLVQNLVVGNRALFGGGGGVAVSLTTFSRGPLLLANTIADNFAFDGSGLYVTGDAAALEIDGNVIRGAPSQPAVFCDTSRPPAFGDGDYWSPGAPGVLGTCGAPPANAVALAADPLFVDAASGDYRLAPASPCVDVVRSTASRPPTDLAGAPRVQNGAADLGAYEAASSPRLALSTSRVDFGARVVGAPGAAQPVTITNSGASATTLAGLDVAPPFAADDVTGALASGASRDATFTFAPTHAGRTTGLARLRFDGADVSTPVALVGVGIAPRLEGPERLAFGARWVGSTSPTARATFSNPNPFAVAVDAPRALSAGSDFAVTSACGAELPAAGTCPVDVTFRPSAPGVRRGVLELPLAAGGRLVVPLEGDGLDLAITAPAEVFASTTGEASFSIVVTPRGGSAPGTVGLSCLGAPAGARCTVDPAEISPGSQAFTARVDVAPDPATPVASGARAARGGGAGAAALWLAPALAALTLRRGRRLGPLVLAVALGCAGDSNGGRSGSSGPIAPGDYTLTIAVRSGALERTAAVVLHVR